MKERIIRQHLKRIRIEYDFTLDSVQKKDLLQHSTATSSI